MSRTRRWDCGLTGNDSKATDAEAGISMLKVVVDKDIPFLKGVLEHCGTVVYLEGSAIRNDDLRDADALIVRTRTKCNRSLLEGTKIRFIASATIGFDHIDAAYCAANNIFWTNAAGCNSSSVQQYVAAALFHLANKLDLELSQLTIGIVGVGNVGSKVARLCEIIGMRVLLNDPPRERREGKQNFVPIGTIVEHADIVTFHVPLNLEGEDRTYHLVDGRFLSRMKSSQIVINTSRGEVVETPALRSTLAAKKLAACVLDVWEHEPAIDLELLGGANIATPHIAGYSADGKANGTAMSVQALSRFFKLGMDTWTPANVPEPENTLIDLDCAPLRRQKVLCKLVTRTYDILSDDQRLRNAPATFEHQRAAYPLRREFPSYTVQLKNANSDLVSAAQQLGFTVKT